MTPREPDRYEEKARELLEAHDLNRSTIAATLRQAADEALERVRLHFNDVEHGPLSLARAREWLDREIRSLASPAAAPAAETCRAECASRMPDYSHYECTLPKGHSGAHREGGTEWTDKDTVVSPPSEPVAPSLLPRVLAALEYANGFDIFAEYRYDHLAAELRQYIAGLEPAEKRIAELETALLRRAGDALDFDEIWDTDCKRKEKMSRYLLIRPSELREWAAKLAARTPPQSGDRK